MTFDLICAVPKGAVSFKAGYRGGRIFGGVPNFLASFYLGIKYFGKNCKISDGP